MLGVDWDSKLFDDADETVMRLLPPCSSGRSSGSWFAYGLVGCWGAVNVRTVQFSETESTEKGGPGLLTASVLVCFSELDFVHPR